ncbi:hypothetical protein PHYSODRAFT_298418 [Phytophthora sojae]|uniref:Uncharacterized protein n=1 Tax=Phytophthora sojae (strain P6497) TaxID=1094619 RepID=G4Z553_PHYSP|nr:hypothetical protein PHYSODRAFT_298418 [Phytophthora sojae]EGZ20196.1 hypothetical protein PHYSODRAFT_298418 [Phytophthora sojae]|eukprot:XP_009522913.1 hypothetical protein PHYSODRAFT_298418 [Phytophthora sojae]
MIFVKKKKKNIFLEKDELAHFNRRRNFIAMKKCTLKKIGDFSTLPALVKSWDSQNPIPRGNEGAESPHINDSTEESTAPLPSTSKLAVKRRKARAHKATRKRAKQPEYRNDFSADLLSEYFGDVMSKPSTEFEQQSAINNRGTNEKPRLKKPKRAFNGSDCDSESSEWDSCASSLGPCEKDDEDDDEEEGGDQLLQQEGGDGEEDDEEESKGDSNAPEILAAELWGPAQGLMPPEVEEVLNPRHQSGSPAPLNTSSPAEVPPPPVAAPPTAEAVLLQVIKEAKNYSGAISSSSEWTSRLFDLLGVSTGSFLEQLGRPSPADFVGLLEQTVKPLAEWSSLAGQDDGDMAASINRIVDAATLLPSKASAEVNVEPTMEQIRTLEADVESTSDPDRAKLRRIKAEEKDMEVCMKITGLLSAQRERIDCYDQMITERQGCCHTVVVPATPGGSEVARETCTRANEKATKLSEDLFYASSSVLGVMDDQSRDLVYKFTFEQQVSTLRCKAAELISCALEKHGDRLGTSLLEYVISALGRMDKMKKHLAGYEFASTRYEDTYPSDQEERMRSRYDELQGLVDTLRTEMRGVITSQANLWRPGTDRVERLLCEAKDHARLLNSRVGEEILMGEGDCIEWK